MNKFKIEEPNTPYFDPQNRKQKEFLIRNDSNKLVGNVILILTDNENNNEHSFINIELTESIFNSEYLKTDNFFKKFSLISESNHLRIFYKKLNRNTDLTLEEDFAKRVIIVSKIVNSIVDILNKIEEIENIEGE